MESEELLEIAERANDRSKRAVGLTTAVGAALLALVTLMGHRLHTEEVVLQTKAADGWAYYQAKNTRSQMYATDAKLAELAGPPGAAVAAEWRKKADDERRQADQIRHDNEERDGETSVIARRATFFDASEVFLEVAIVLCSITLLTDRPMYWRLSFIGTALGVLTAAIGVFRS
jgi:uncharacterized protein DUF4337